MQRLARPLPLKRTDGDALAAFAGAELMVIPKAEHAVPFEKPADLIRTIARLA
jgi:pimeloyl-ACP methyl ester carboxylesterase